MTELNQNQKPSLPAIRKVDFKGKQKFAVNSWELFEKLERTNYPAWCRKEILDKGIEGLDYNITTSYTLRGRGRRNEYDLSIEFTKHLVLQSSTDFGKKYRQHLINFEEQHKDKVVKLSQTPEAAKFFTNYLESFKTISPTAYQTMGAKISKEVFGIEVPYYFLPEIKESRKPANEIAALYGSTKQAIGRIATQLGLKKMPYGECRMSIAAHSNKEVEMWFYNQEAIELIKKRLSKQPFESDTLFSE